MINVAGAAIEFHRRIVAMVYFQMNGVHTHFARFLLDKSNGLPAKTAAAIGGDNVQFINEGVVAVEFKAEAKSQDDVTNHGSAVVEKPDTAKGWKRQELTEGRTSGGLVKGNGTGFLLGEASHHLEECGFVLKCGFPQLQRGHVILRFAR